MQCIILLFVSSTSKDLENIIVSVALLGHKKKLPGPVLAKATAPTDHEKVPLWVYWIDGSNGIPSILALEGQESAHL